MTLLSWNVDRRTVRQSEQIERIESTGADIVSLQEVTPTTVSGFRDGLAELGFSYSISSKDPELFVASRWPLVESDTVFDVPRPQRDVLSSVVDSPFGEIEVHSAHVPTKSKSAPLKIATCKGIFEGLATSSNRHRVLCGDLNLPKSEHIDGTVESFFSSSHEGHRAELDLVIGLGKFDLKDTFRALNGYQKDGYSWVSAHGNRFRLDHILASESLHAVKCEYLHDPSNGKLSDHSIIYAVFEPRRR